MKHSNTWFLTTTGRQFWPASPDPEQIQIEDIAHALSNLCRFGGHTREFYSVAQHSVLVSQNVPDDLRLVGLMHDATEAYCGDMIRPLKNVLPEFKELENGIWKAIAKRFGLPDEIPPEVKEADDVLLMTERRDLMPVHPAPWGLDHAKPLEGIITPWPPLNAEGLFLCHFNFLTHTAKLA